MRNEWTPAVLGDLITIKSGVSPALANLSSHGALPFIKVEDLNNSKKYQIIGRSFTSLSNLEVKAGSVLFAKRGGAIMVNKVRIASVSVALDTNMMALTPKDGKIYSEYLYYFILREELSKIADVSSIPQINNKHINPYPISLPPLPEQRKIAAILRTWDLGLEKLSALRKAKERLRLWLRTEVVTGKRRLPRFSGLWREVPLSDVLTEHGEASTGAEEVYSVSVHKGLVNQIEHLGRSFAAANTDHYNRVLPGDIVYTKSPTGDFPLGIIKQSRVDHAVIVSPLYGVFTPLRRELGIMLEAHFEAPLAVSNYLNPLVQKGAKNTIAITNKRFLEGKLHLPLDPNEQKAIAAILETSRRELDAIDREIAALTRQKRGLMQKLLTGEWEVSP